MNKIKTLLFSVFISTFYFISPMAKTEITKEDLIKAMKTLNLNLIEEYKKSGGKIPENVRAELRDILHKKWNWVNFHSDLREQISVVWWMANVAIVFTPLTLLSASLFAKSSFGKKLFKKLGINEKKFEYNKKIILSPLILASIMTPISLGLYYVWNTSEKYGRMQSYLREFI
ncbi:hypothetical protein [Candidatus Babela massiliensis]|uniref:Uncharacterized protein n=1 Tax=Candidatus Babela massiliensis TaxID=673862 RepID=V6DIR3_9BACT|nr:hypothetical protein [Candidatus Babela massiliensis]CDK30823.1 hypothetical protein BABL1_gene_192 [Candidatus Babela massiliensis]